jgi:hypothetical protein
MQNGKICMASAWQTAGSACLDTSAQARRELLIRVGSATIRRLLTAKELSPETRHPRLLVVAFASRELMALDPATGKFAARIRRRSIKILRLYEKSLDKDRGS